MSLSDLGPFLNAIADPARRRILQALKTSPSSSREKSGLCAGDLEDCVKLSQPTVSHHMKILEQAGLVMVKKDGTWRRYRRNEKLITECIRGLKKAI